MKFIKMMRTPGVYSLIFTFLLMGVQVPVMADMVGTADLDLQAELQLQRDEVHQFIAREDVRAAMLDYGVDAGDLDTRIDSLSSVELMQIQNQLADLPAGSGALGVVLGIIVIFVLLDLLGATDVFPRI